METNSYNQEREIEGIANETYTINNTNGEPNSEGSVLYQNGKPFCRILASEILGIRNLKVFGSSIPILRSRRIGLLLEKRPMLALGINHAIKPPLGGELIAVMLISVRESDKGFNAIFEV
jgi:hypothetical protein